MCAFLYPGEYLDSTYEIDFDKLYKEGYRGIIFDIDNTLVPHGAPADERAILLFKHLKELGFRCMLLSNNKEPRVKMFNDAVHVQYIYKAGKPKPAYSPGGMLNAFAWPLTSDANSEHPSFTAWTTRVSNPVRYPRFRASASVALQQAAFAIGVLRHI